MENFYEDVIDWGELADELLEYMIDNWGVLWTAQWLWDEGWNIGAINYLLGSDFTEDDMKDPERYGD